MKRMKRHLLLLTLVVALLAIPTLVVAAKELGLLTITGPGIKGELTLNDPRSLMNLQEKGFFDEAVLSQVPEGLNLQAGYTINAHLNLDGKLVPFVEMVYYPTRDGEGGYVHYTGRMQGETLQKVDQWSHLSLTADNTFRELMSANNVVLQSSLVTAAVKAEPPAAAAQPATAPAGKPATLPISPLVLSLAALVVVLAAAGLILRRRAVHSTG